MSAAIKAGRATYSGDPGLLGGLVGGAVGFLTGGPAGAIAGAATGLGINGKKRTVAPTAGGIGPGIIPSKRMDRAWKRMSTRTIPRTGGIRAMPGMGKTGGGQSPIVVNPPFGGEPGIGVSIPGIGMDWRLGGTIPGTNGEVYVEGTTGEVRELVQQDRKVTRYGSPPGPGYHLNKSGYWLKNGTYIPKGTVWVKNRRRNPLNPRALDRAMGRLSSAKRAAGKLGRVTIRKKCG